MLLPTLQFTENVPELLTFYASVSGGAVVGGTAPVSGNFTVFVPSGGATAGGTAPVSVVLVQQYTITVDGGAKVGGEATVATLFVNLYAIAPEGGAVVGGVAPVFESIPYVPSGGAVVGGESPVSERIAYVPSGGVVAGGAPEILYVASIPVSGGAVVGGTASVAFVVVEIPAGGINIGGEAAVRTYEAWYAPSGGVVVGGIALAYALRSGEETTPENPYNDDFPGWAINAETGAPSRYLRLAANSFTQFMGRTLLANAAGIYALEGEDDAGRPIHGGIHIPQSDFGSEKDKRVEDVFIGLRTNGQLRLSVATNNGARHYYTIPVTEEITQATRVKLGQGLKGRYWDMRLENVAGASLEFESMAFTPLELKRHGK